jgi:hypothetical protein
MTGVDGGSSVACEDDDAGHGGDENASVAIDIEVSFSGAWNSSGSINEMILSAREFKETSTAANPSVAQGIVGD